MGTAATYPLFRDYTMSRMRSEQAIAAGQPPAIASIIAGQNDEMRHGCSVFCSDVANDYAAQPEHGPESVAAIRDLRGRPEGARRDILAEQTKTNLLGLLRQRDDWKTSVVVNLQSQQSNLPELPPADLRFSQTGFGIKLQLDLTISKNVDVSLVERELLRAILLEMVYRNQPHITAGAMLVEPPDWLINGVLVLAPGRERGPLIEALADTGKPLPLEKFFANVPRFLILRAARFTAHMLLRWCKCSWTRKTAERSWRNTSIICTTLQMIRLRISRRNFRYSRMTPRGRGSWR